MASRAVRVLIGLLHGLMAFNGFEGVGGFGFEGFGGFKGSNRAFTWRSGLQ